MVSYFCPLWFRQYLRIVTYGRFSGKYRTIYAELPERQLDFPPYACHTYVFLNSGNTIRIVSVWSVFVGQSVSKKKNNPSCWNIFREINILFLRGTCFFPRSYKLYQCHAISAPAIAKIAPAWRFLPCLSRRCRRVNYRRFFLIKDDDMGHGLSSVNNFHHGIPLPSHVMVMCAHLGFHGKWKGNTSNTTP